MTASLQLARNGRFAKLWMAQILSQIAQNLLNFALIIRVFDLAAGTRFANVSVAMLILSFAVPSIFFAAVAGVYVDYWDRRNVLVVANLLRAGLVLGYLLVEHNFWAVLILSFIVSAITQFFVPAEAASIPSLVERRALVAANSLFLFTLYGSFIVGYAAAAPIVGWLGPQAPYVLTSVMFGLAAILSYLLPVLSAKAEKSNLSVIVRRTKQALIDNWGAIRSNRNLYFPIMELSLTQTMVGVMLVLAPALSLAVLGVPLVAASHFLIIPAGLGMVAGVVLVNRLTGFSKLPLASWSLLAAGAALVLLGLTGQLLRPFHGRPLAGAAGIGWAVAVLTFVLGAMNAIISVASQTLLQENTTDPMRGRVFGALNMAVNITATLPIFLAGILADLFSVTKVIVAAGVLVLGFAVFQLGFYRPKYGS